MFVGFTPTNTEVGVRMTHPRRRSIQGLKTPKFKNNITLIQYTGEHTYARIRAG